MRVTRVTRIFFQGEELCFDYGDTIRAGKLVLVEPGEGLQNPDYIKPGIEKLVDAPPRPGVKNQISSGSDTNLSNANAGKPGSAKPVLNVPRVLVIDNLLDKKVETKEISPGDGEEPVSQNPEAETNKSVIEEEATDNSVTGVLTSLSRRSRCLCKAKNCKKWLPFNQELFL